tara:strand:- start:11569 stop:11781 length:213 start_codon:yes stop_codon:yes gene_type:complete
MLRLSDEALAAIMMALQKSLFEQSDIVPTLKGFNFRVNEKEELYVMNPPIFKIPETGDDDVYPFDENGSD